jgi:hypothetical protein
MIIKIDANIVSTIKENSSDGLYNTSRVKLPLVEIDVFTGGYLY